LLDRVHTHPCIDPAIWLLLEEGAHLVLLR